MQSQGEPNEKLTQVFDAKQESEAMVVHGLLQSSGIESILTSPEAPQDILPGVGGTVILVREEQAGEAREIISAYQRTATTNTDSAGANDTTDPTAA